MAASDTVPEASGYQLLDSGHGAKLEQVGPYRLARPAPQALWRPAHPPEVWDTAVACYGRRSSGAGVWTYKHPLPPAWVVAYCDLTLQVKLTDFGHLGFFAEHGPHWQWVRQHIHAARRPIRLLNAFAYTGGMSLAAAAAGASVVHLDAADGIVAWARDNAQLSGLAAAPIRWVVEDVTKFLAREARRGHRYDAIVLDPPSFGRGSKGEVWKLERDLPALLERCAEVLSDEPLFVLLSAHTPGVTPLVLEHLLVDMLGQRGGLLSSHGNGAAARRRPACTPERRAGTLEQGLSTMAQLITSLHNPTMKQLVKLRQRRERDRHQLMLIDGARALRLALHNAWPITTIYFAEHLAHVHTDLLQRARAARVALQAVTAAVFHKIGYGDNPDGVLGVASQPGVGLARLPGVAVPLYLITEGLEKPGNLGAILRSADAAGVTGLIVCDSQTDIWNPNVIRASQGAFCTVPLAVATVQEARGWLRQRQIQILAAMPTAPRLYTEVDLCLPSALALGAEHSGLSTAWQGDTPIRIPMTGQVDSLNVAQTASIILFEAIRQRLQRRPM